MTGSVEELKNEIRRLQQKIELVENGSISEGERKRIRLEESLTESFEASGLSPTQARLAARGTAAERIGEVDRLAHTVICLAEEANRRACNDCPNREKWPPKVDSLLIADKNSAS